MKNEKQKINKQVVLIVSLAVLLILAAGYIGLNKYNTTKQQEQFEIYQIGMQAGFEQAITQLVKQVATCQQVPITVQNQTINVIAVECLKNQ